MLRRVTLVRTDISEEISTSIIRVTRIGELGTTLTLTSNRLVLWRNTIHIHTHNINIVLIRNMCLLLVTVNVVPSSPILVTLIMEALLSSETSVITKVTRRNIPEIGILFFTPTNSVALSPRANYTDCSTATCQQNLVSTFIDRGVSRGQRGGSPRSLISYF
jgi:hypothetical protein